MHKCCKSNSKNSISFFYKIQVKVAIYSKKNHLAKKKIANVLCIKYIYLAKNSRKSCKKFKKYSLPVKKEI